MTESVEDFKKKREKSLDELINFRTTKRNQTMSKAKNARETGALKRDLSTRRMLSGQIKYIKE